MNGTVLFSFVVFRGCGSSLFLRNGSYALADRTFAFFPWN